MFKKNGLDISDLDPDNENYTSLRKNETKIKRQIKSPLLNKNKSNSNMISLKYFDGQNRISNLGGNSDINKSVVLEKRSLSPVGTDLIYRYHK